MHTCRAALLLLLLPLASACNTVQRVKVKSSPSGARVLIDGKDSGLTTPAEVVLPMSEDSYEITLHKNGYNPIHRTVRLETDVDVIDADEVATK